MPPPTAASVVVGAAIGFLNGALVGAMGLPSIVVTLAMLAILRDGLRWITGGAGVRALPSAFRGFGFDQVAGRTSVIGSAVILTALAGWLLSRVAAGRAI